MQGILPLELVVVDIQGELAVVVEEEKEVEAVGGIWGERVVAVEMEGVDMGSRRSSTLCMAFGLCRLLFLLLLMWSRRK